MLKDAPPWTVQMGTDSDPVLIHLMSQQVPTATQTTKYPAKDS